LDSQLDETIIDKAVKRDELKEIKQYAINQMRVANRINKKLFKKQKGEIQEIKTNDAH
jgi:hypothetical protein